MHGNDKPRGAHRCEVYDECAYWAWGEYVSPDGKETKWICSNCARLYLLDGWKLAPKE